MHKILILSENLTICPDTANVFYLTVFWHQRDNKTDRDTVIVFHFRCLMLFAMQPEKMCPSEGTLRNLGLIFLVRRETEIILQKIIGFPSYEFQANIFRRFYFRLQES